ncbi:DUF6207 family protein [Streptomyces umbrinus]|uniref:DUF6207 family protein n=1 Tax=Streptomyces umbrinus TaxID=67370 RepID=UPI003C2F3D46
MHERVLTDVDPIQETHVSEPGLLVIDAAGIDDDTVFALQDVGQPGVRLRLYVDLRQVLAQTSPSERALATSTR